MTNRLNPTRPGMTLAAFEAEGDTSTAVEAHDPTQPRWDAFYVSGKGANKTIGAFHTTCAYRGRTKDGVELVRIRNDYEPGKGYVDARAEELLVAMLQAGLPIDAFCIWDATKPYAAGEGRKAPYSAKELAALAKGQTITIGRPSWGFGKPRIKIGTHDPIRPEKAARTSTRIGD